MHKMKRFLSVVLTVCMLVSILATGALAITITEKPDNGTTVGQPFAPGTGGSRNFRIPGIVTMDDGTLIAACDARWNHAGDGAGLDTIVSVSKDNGENWEYTFANYLGDNGDVYNNLSTCIIDPAIGTDGTTAYLIADLWPAGIALNTSKYGPIAGENGFDNNGNLLLRALEDDTIAIGGNGYNTMAGQISRYVYYLDLENLTLHNADGSAIEGYTVDAYFNIVSDDGSVDTNLFFSDSPYQPYPTDYLYMTTSTDGLNWSVPTLLNLKEEAEQTLLVGPGNGTYDKVNDRMIFTAYEHTSGYERASLIWMDSEGNWYRSEDATNNASNKSSEATAVVLADGTVRVFFRDYTNYLHYSDYVWSDEINNYVVSAREVGTNAPKRQNNQLTSILYSERIDGKEAILVACAANPNERRDGHLYVFLVNEDNSMELAYDYDIIPNENEVYAYNCITELDNGKLGLLYESNGSEITYIVIDMADVLIRDNNPNLTVQEIELLAGYSKTIVDNSGYHSNADLSELDTSVAEVEISGEETVTNAAMVLSNNATIDLDDCQYTFTASGDYFHVSAEVDGTTVYLNHYSTANSNVPNIASPAGEIAVLEGTEENMFKLQAQVIEGGSGAARTLHFHAEFDKPYWNRCGNDSSYKCQEYLFRKATAGETSSTEIPGYVMLTSVDEVVDGGKYLIAAKNDAGNWFVLNPSASTTASMDHVAQIMGSTTVGYSEITFTGVAAGYTEVLIGSTIYKITVHNVEKVNVNLTVGGTATVTESTGNYTDADISELDTDIATVTMVGVDGTTHNGLSLKPVSELTDGKYVIVNTRANKFVTNAPASAAADAGAGSGLFLNGTITDDVAAAAVWTITATNGGYTLQDASGKYMTISSNNASVTDASNTIAMNYASGTWTIAQNGAYLNHFGGGSSTCAAGWLSSAAATDSGSQFDIYTYSEEVRSASTEITFTGVAAGTTKVLIGRTLYTVIVTDGTGECPHNYEVTEVVEPTCTKSGYSVYTCTLCGDSYKDDPTEPEHKWDEGTVTAPTCVDLGFTTYTCTVCSYEYVDEASWTDALGHDHVNGKCTRCEDTLTSAFVDVPAGQFYFDPVEWAVGKGITTGTSATTFDPDGKCMRAVVVTFLWRAKGCPEPTITENPFSDVKESDYFYKAVLWALENEITNGISATEFGSEVYCNRAQVVTFLWRTMGKPESSADVAFEDVEDGKFYTEAVAWAVENEITNGLSATEFGVEGICNRAQVVTFLYRTLAE